MSAMERNAFLSHLPHLSVAITIKYSVENNINMLRSLLARVHIATAIQKLCIKHFLPNNIPHDQDMRAD